MTSGGQQAQDVAPRAARQHEHALRRARGRDPLRGGLVRLERARPDQLHREHRAATAHVGDGGDLVLQGGEPGEDRRLDRPGGTRPGRRARRSPATRARPRTPAGCRRTCRPAHPACTASSSSARPVTAPSGSPPAMPLARATRSGTTPSCSIANMAPVRANPVCTSSATSTIPRSAAHAASVGRKPGAGTTNPPSPRMGSTTSAATWSAPTCRSATSIARSAACSPVMPGGVAQRVRRRDPVHLARERSEAGLVRHGPRRHRHREVGAPVVGVVEHEDRGAPGRPPGDLDGVLDGLGPGVHQHRPLLVGRPASRARAPSQTATYSSYGLIMKHVCVKSAACAATAAVTSGALAPTDVTAMPDPRSMSTLPSTSSMTAPAGPGHVDRQGRGDAGRDRRRRGARRGRPSAARGSSCAGRGAARAGSRRRKRWSWGDASADLVPGKAFRRRNPPNSGGPILGRVRVDPRRAVSGFSECGGQDGPARVEIGPALRVRAAV